MLLMIDNYDSFTYNLVQYFGELKVDVQVHRNDQITIKEIEALKETSTLLNYMNSNNWEFIDRKAISELNNPIWMSYLFRKRK